jgi:hypothetical protein
MPIEQVSKIKNVYRVKFKIYFDIFYGNTIIGLNSAITLLILE